MGLTLNELIEALTKLRDGGASLVVVVVPGEFPYPIERVDDNPVYFGAAAICVKPHLG